MNTTSTSRTIAPTNAEIGHQITKVLDYAARVGLRSPQIQYTPFRHTIVVVTARATQAQAHNLADLLGASRMTLGAPYGDDTGQQRNYDGPMGLFRLSIVVDAGADR